MLIYHPAYDIHHCCFRTLQLLSVLPKKAYDTERIRILDFFLLFPEQIHTIRFPNEVKNQRKYFKSLRNRYEDVRDPKRIFFQLEGYQLTAFQVLAINGLIDSGQLNSDMVQRTTKELSPALAKAVSTANSKMSPILELLSGPLNKVDLYGDSGLKFRTKLFEYRYDAT